MAVGESKKGQGEKGSRAQVRGRHRAGVSGPSARTHLQPLRPAPAPHVWLRRAGVAVTVMSEGSLLKARCGTSRPCTRSAAENYSFCGGPVTRLLSSFRRQPTTSMTSLRRRRMRERDIERIQKISRFAKLPLLSHLFSARAMST